MATTPLAKNLRLYSAFLTLAEAGDTGTYALTYRADTPDGVFERRHVGTYVAGDVITAVLTDEIAAFGTELVSAGYTLT